MKQSSFSAIPAHVSRHFFTRFLLITLRIWLFYSAWIPEEVHKKIFWIVNSPHIQMVCLFLSQNSEGCATQHQRQSAEPAGSKYSNASQTDDIPSRVTTKSRTMHARRSSHPPTCTSRAFFCSCSHWRYTSFASFLSSSFPFSLSTSSINGSWPSLPSSCSFSFSCSC